MMLTQEQRLMVEENHNLIYGFMNLKKNHIDDLYGLLSITLCNAAANYDESFGVKFSTYAYKCMENACAREYYNSSLDVRKINQNLISYNYCSDDTDEPMLFKIAGNSDTESDAIFNCIIENTKKLMNKLDCNIVDGISRGMRTKDIASENGMSTQYINQRKKHIGKVFKKVGLS